MLQLSVKTTGVSSLLCNDRFWETNITAAVGSLWAHFWNKLEKKKLCWHTGPCWFFLQNDHILFLEARPDEAMPGYATKPANPQHPDDTSLALSHLHPQLFSFAHHEDKTAEWELLWLRVHLWTAAVATLLSFLFSPPLDQILLSTILQFLYGQSPCTTLFNTSPSPSWAWVQTSPYSQSYVVLRLGPPGLLTDFCRVLVGGKACPGIWPCPPSVAGWGPRGWEVLTSRGPVCVGFCCGADNTWAGPDHCALKAAVGV